VNVKGYDLASVAESFVEDFVDGVAASKFVADPQCIQWRSGSSGANDEVLHLDEVLAGSGGGHVVSATLSGVRPGGAVQGDARMA